MESTRKELIFHHDQEDNVTCYCGEIMPWNCFERIYDDHGCYAGKACCEKCFEDNAGINLHYSRRDALENGENIDSDY